MQECRSAGMQELNIYWFWELSLLAIEIKNILYD